MKQVKSLYNSNSQELLGRVTLSGKNLFNRSAYVLVTNERNAPKGYKAIISTHDLSDKSSTPYIQVDNISNFNEGDKLTSPQMERYVFCMKSTLHLMLFLQQLVAIIVASCVLNHLFCKRKTGLTLT